jgi:superoxide dismutase, Fe-Mn family
LAAPDELAAAVKESFGSLDGRKSQLTQAALDVQGSGWGAMGWVELDATMSNRRLHESLLAATGRGPWV